MNKKIDVPYFEEKLKLLARDIDDYAESSGDLSRALLRLAITADKDAALWESALLQPAESAPLETPVVVIFDDKQSCLAYRHFDARVGGAEWYLIDDSPLLKTPTYCMLLNNAEAAQEKSLATTSSEINFYKEGYRAARIGKPSQPIYSDIQEDWWVEGYKDALDDIQNEKAQQSREKEVYEVVPHPKLKRDYKGRLVRTLVEMENGWGIIPAGAIATISNQSPKGSTLSVNKCDCCELSAKISGVSKEKIEFVHWGWSSTRENDVNENKEDDSKCGA